MEARLFKLLTKLLLAGMLIPLCACAARTGVAPGTQAMPAAFPARLLPRPSQLDVPTADPRSGSALSAADLYRSGADIFNAHLVTVVGDRAEFSPDFDLGSSGTAGLAYAIYGFSIPGYAGQASIRTYWPIQPPAGTAYLAVSDANQDRWRCFAIPADGRVPIPGLSSFPDSGGIFYCAVILTGTAPAQLGTLRIGAGVIEGELTARPQASVMPLLSTLDASELSLLGATLGNFEYDLDANGSFETPSAGGMQGLNLSGPETRVVGLRFSSSEGESFQRSITLRSLAGTWAAQPLATTPSSAFDVYSPAIGVVGGRPCVAYVFHFLGDPPDIPPGERLVQVLWANDFEASSWSGPSSPLPTEAAKRIFSVVDADGYPAVLAARTDDALFCVRADDLAASSWSVSPNLGTSSDTDRAAALIEYQGRLGCAWSTAGGEVWYHQTSGLDNNWLDPQPTGLTTLLELGLAANNSARTLATVTRDEGLGHNKLSMYTSSDSAGAVWNFQASVGKEAAPLAAYYPSAAPVRGDIAYSAKLKAQQFTLFKTTAALGLDNDGSFFSIGGACLGYDVGIADYLQGPDGLVELGVVNFGAAGSYLRYQAIDGTGADGLDLGRHCNLACYEEVPFLAYEDRTNYAIRFATMH